MGLEAVPPLVYLFKKMGKEVTYNDKLRFNYLIGKALIENQKSKVPK